MSCWFDISNYNIVPQLNLSVIYPYQLSTKLSVLFEQSIVKILKSLWSSTFLWYKMAASIEIVDVDAETVDPNEVSPMEEENDENRNPEMSELQSSGFIAFGILLKCSIKSSYNAGADLGVGGDAAASFVRDLIPCRTKGSPLGAILRYPFLADWR